MAGNARGFLKNCLYTVWRIHYNDIVMVDVVRGKKMIIDDRERDDAAKY